MADKYDPNDEYYKDYEDFIEELNKDMGFPKDFGKNKPKTTSSSMPGILRKKNTHKATQPSNPSAAQTTSLPSQLPLPLWEIDTEEIPLSKLYPDNSNKKLTPEEIKKYNSKSESKNCIQCGCVLNKDRPVWNIISWCPVCEGD